MKKLLLFLTLLLLFVSPSYAGEKRVFPENGIMAFQGLDDTSQPPLAKDGRASDLQNIVLDITGSIEKRHGYSIKNGTLDTGDSGDDFEAVTGIYELYKSNGSRYVIAICGSKAFYDSSGTWVDRTGTTITEGQNNQWSWVTALDYAIGTNGVNPPLRWAGTDYTANLPFTGLTNAITKAKCVVWWKNYLIFGNTTEGGTNHTTRIRWSNVGTISTWSDNDFVDIATLGGQQIEGFGLLYDDLYVFLTDSIYKVSLVGGDELINVSKISEGIGSIAKNSIQNISIGNTEGIIFLSRDKNINYLDGVKISEISTLIRTTTDNISTSRLPYAVSSNDRVNSHYYLCITNSTDSVSTSTNNLLLDYYYQTGEWSKHIQIDANSMGIANDSNGNPQVYFGNYKSFVYQLNDTTMNNDVAGNSGTFEDEDAIDTSTLASGLTILYDEDLADYDKLLLHFEGTNGSNIFIDQAGKAVTAIGDAKISTSTYKFGSASGYFDGIGDYISLADSDDWNLGTGDFTIDCWVYPTNLASDYLGVFSQFVNDTNRVEFYIRTDGSIVFLINSASDIFVASAAGKVVVNTWQHVAIIRYGNIWTVYVDGVSVGTQTKSFTYPDLAASFLIGAYNGAGAFVGNIDEFHISKSIARQTGNFTPSTSAYTNSSMSSKYRGAILRITSGTGSGEERVICDTTSSGIVVTDDITSGINATYSIGDIDSYYTTKWYDCGNAAIFKNFMELYIWTETQQSQTMAVSYATDWSSTISSQNVNLYGGDTLSGTGITGTSTWSGIQANFTRIPLNVSGRFIKTRFRESDIDATMKLFGYGFLLKDESPL